jgi:NADH-quinone oxidoreductase subunit H
LSHLTNFEAFLLLSVLKVAVVLVITLMCVAYTVLLERKLLGRMQNRWGPSRVGPFGLLQPLVDGAKLFLKEDMMPTAVERPLFLVAPVIALGCALISVGVVPFGALTRVSLNGGPGVDVFEIANVNIGLLVILGITSIGVYGIALSGWSSNNKYSLLGSLRSTAQVVSYELALGCRSSEWCCARSRSTCAPSSTANRPTASSPGTSSAASSSLPSSST